MTTRLRKTAIMAGALLTLLITQSASAQDTCSVTANNITAARTVENHLPQDTEGPFAADGERLYIFVDVANPGEAQELTLSWHHAERDRTSEQTLEVGHSGSWRTWAYRALTRRTAGTWHVEVHDAAGCLVGALDFVVAEAE